MKARGEKEVWLHAFLTSAQTEIPGHRGLPVSSGETAPCAH